MWAVYFLLCHVFVIKCLAMSLNELEDFSNFLKETSRLDLNVKSNLPDEDSDDEEPVSDHAWEISGKFEGDLILNERQRKMIIENVAEGLARNGVTDSTKRWPNNEVIYFIQPEHFNSDQVAAIQDGIEDLARVSCVKFRPYVKGDRDAVVIQGSRRGCFSQVGYQGGYQVLNLSRRHPAGRGCFRHGTVVHEMLHTLGFYHMQSSPDRDDYINVIWENIIKPARHNFRKYNSFSVSDFGVGYDYDSVLHYSRKAFSNNGQDTIVPKKLGATIGQRIGLSDKDIQKLNKMYCDADSGLLIEDSIAKKSDKKKSVKNKPFVGHGLGYQKGKTVIITLPNAESRQLVPQFPVFNHFSKTTQELPTELIQGNGNREEMNLYTYELPLTSNDEEITKSQAIQQEHFGNEKLRLTKPYSDQGRKVEDEDLVETFYRLSEMSKPEKIQTNQYKEDDYSVIVSQKIKAHQPDDLKKISTLLLSPSMRHIENQDVENIGYEIPNARSNYYAVANEGPQNYYFNFANNINPNGQRTSEPNKNLAYSFSSSPIKLQETEENLPVHNVWHPQYDKYSETRYSPETNKEQVNYSHYRVETPTFPKMYKVHELEQISDRSPRRFEHYR